MSDVQLHLRGADEVIPGSQLERTEIGRVVDGDDFDIEGHIMYMPHGGSLLDLSTGEMYAEECSANIMVERLVDEYITLRND